MTIKPLCGKLLVRINEKEIDIVKSKQWLRSPGLKAKWKTFNCSTTPKHPKQKWPKNIRTKTVAVNCRLCGGE